MRNLENVYCIKQRDRIKMIDLQSLEMADVPYGTGKEEIYLRASRMGIGEAYQKRLIPVPDNVTVSPVLVTGFDCNYRCTYCYQKEDRGIHEKMKPEDIYRIIVFYDHYGETYNKDVEIETIGLIGGEPLLLSNRELLQECVSVWKDKSFILTTNGTYLIEYLDLLERINVHVRVSLDGTRDIHYARRKTDVAGAYERAIEGIKCLLERQIPVTILILFDSENTEDYPIFFDEMEEIGWRSDKNLQLAFISMISNGCDDIDEDASFKNLRAVTKLAGQDMRTKDVYAGKLIPGGENYPETIQLAETGYYNPYRCEQLRGSSFSFLPNGDIYPCMTIKKEKRFTVGTFKPEITINDSFIKIMENRRCDIIRKCVNCKMRAFCRSGCMATAIAHGGDAATPYCGSWENEETIQWLDSLYRV